MTSNQIQPCFNRVLVRLDLPETSKILSVDSAERADANITVVAIGPDVKAVAVGDKVMLLPECNKLPPKLDDATDKVLFALIHDSHIIAIIK